MPNEGPMKSAYLKDDAFLADVSSAPRGPRVVNLWWLGQSGFLVENDGRFLLMDAYLSDSLTRKYALTDLPHVRMSERVVDPARLGFVSVVTCSHSHTDHMDQETIRPLLEANPAMRLVIPEAARQLAAERLGVEPGRPLGMNDGVTLEAAGFTIHGLPSAHDERQTDPSGNDRWLGYVVEAGGWRLYHSGDTRDYDGLSARLAGFRLDLGLLPINGWAAERRVAGNLDAAEAAALAYRSGMRLVVPHHFDMFEFNTADPGVFEAEARRLGLSVKVLRPGERLTLGASHSLP
jgi:L-ascorbate metabolism protein UlaG (beta-lactamase superfamily)